MSTTAQTANLTRRIPLSRCNGATIEFFDVRVDALWQRGFPLQRSR